MKMRKFNLLTIKKLGVILAFFGGVGSASAQLVEQKDTVLVKPLEIFLLVKPSCMPCHSDQGREKPRNAVNFSIWEQYTPSEQKMLASSIQSEITKGSMPPKGFLKNHPEVSLTELQISQLSQWCDTLKSRP